MTHKDLCTARHRRPSCYLAGKRAQSAGVSARGSAGRGGNSCRGDITHTHVAFQGQHLVAVVTGGQVSLNTRILTLFSCGTCAPGARTTDLARAYARLATALHVRRPTEWRTATLDTLIRAPFSLSGTRQRAWRVGQGAAGGLMGRRWGGCCCGFTAVEGCGRVATWTVRASETNRKAVAQARGAEVERWGAGAGGRTAAQEPHRVGPCPHTSIRAPGLAVARTVMLSGTTPTASRGSASAPPGERDPVAPAGRAAPRRAPRPPCERRRRGIGAAPLCGAQ